MYFIYGYQRDTVYSSESFFTKCETFEEAESIAAENEGEGFTTTIIEGQDITALSELRKCAEERWKQKRKAEIAMAEQESLENARRHYEELKKRFETKIG